MPKTWSARTSALFLFKIKTSRIFNHNEAYAAHVANDNDPSSFLSSQGSVKTLIKSWALRPTFSRPELCSVVSKSILSSPENGAGFRGLFFLFFSSLELCLAEQDKFEVGRGRAHQPIGKKESHFRGCPRGKGCHDYTASIPFRIKFWSSII